MPLKVWQGGESGIALCATEWLLASVRYDVPLEMRRGPVSVTTLRAGERLHAGVHSHVQVETRPHGEAISAFLTSEWLFPSVFQHVAHEDGTLRAGEAALGALERFLICVRIDYKARPELGVRVVVQKVILGFLGWVSLEISCNNRES